MRMRLLVFSILFSSLLFCGRRAFLCSKAVLIRLNQKIFQRDSMLALRLLHFFDRLLWRGERIF
jgi:hypothetical protein